MIINFLKTHSNNNSIPLFIYKRKDKDYCHVIGRYSQQISKLSSALGINEDDDETPILAQSFI